MSSHPSTTDRPVQADSGVFAPLASAKYLMLTTFNPDGVPVHTPVRVAADGDRACFRISRASGAPKRLRHTDWVQVTRCTALGLCRYAPTVDATARLLAGEEASRAAGLLARKCPAWRRLLSSLAQRVPGWQMEYYELRADDDAEEPGQSNGSPPSVAAAFTDQTPSSW